MGLLRHVDGSRVVCLAARVLVGRAPHCGLTLADRRVAREQAVVWFHDGGWWVRDLASRNGTAVDGRTLDAGEHCPLARGSVLRLGSSSEGWRVDDASPPGPVARGPSGALVSGHGRLLALPDDDEVLACVVHRGGRWMLETQDGLTDLEDGAKIELEGVAYTIWLPHTTATAGAGTDLEAATPRLRFRLSADGDELVHAEVSMGATTVSLPVHAPLQLAVTLAQRRLRDKAQRVPASEQGWVRVAHLCRQVPVAAHLIPSHVYRVRQAILAAGVDHGEAVIEARGRRAQRELRFAAWEVEISGPR